MSSPQSARGEGAPPVKPILEVDHVSKVYRLWRAPSDRLLAPLLERVTRTSVLPVAWKSKAKAMAAQRAREFHALHDVGFKLHRGESLAIIGRNGAGKSTLLQIIAGTLTPSHGSVRREGRVAALLELGSGFNFDFTGRENVLLNATLQGLSKAQAEAALEEVAEFAAIGDFLEQPVKTYSSGMMVRLAFAAQTIVRPELMIVDEALAVGDVFFQAKCARFFKERLEHGMSLLLVSHDLSSVKALCKNAIVLHEGRAAFKGPSAEAVSFYHALHQPVIQAGSRVEGGAEVGAALKEKLLPEERRRWRVGATEAGTREVEFVAVRLLDAKGRAASVFAVGDTVLCECVVESKILAEELQFSVEIATRHNFVVYGISTRHLGLPADSARPGEQFLMRYQWVAALGVGEYVVDLGIGLGDRGDGAPLALLHRLAHVVSFSVHHGPFRPDFFGVSNLQARIEKRLD